MKALRFHRYGVPSALAIEELDCRRVRDADAAYAGDVTTPERSSRETSARLGEAARALALEGAATVGVRFVVPYNGFVQRGGIKGGETVLVTGAPGAVGRAATQMA